MEVKIKMRKAIVIVPLALLGIWIVFKLSVGLLSINIEPYSNMPLCAGVLLLVAVFFWGIAKVKDRK
jgi:hypothetical protein